MTKLTRWMKISYAPSTSVCLPPAVWGSALSASLCFLLINPASGILFCFRRCAPISKSDGTYFETEKFSGSNSVLSFGFVLAHYLDFCFCQQRSWRRRRGQRQKRTAAGPHHQYRKNSEE